MTTIGTRLIQRRRPSAATTLLSTIVLLMVSLALSGCAVKFIGDYDETIDHGVSDIQQRADLYLNKLQSAPATPFDQSFYDDINARIASLKSRAAALPKLTILVQQFGNLQAQFDQLQQLDRGSARPFPAPAVTAAQSSIAVSVESILKLELALKRGSTSPPGL